MTFAMVAPPRICGRGMLDMPRRLNFCMRTKNLTSIIACSVLLGLIHPMFLFDQKVFAQESRRTAVSIQGDQFYINGRPTYEGRFWRGHNIAGLLMNSRMVQGIFDDLNPTTRNLWKYPDTGQWDPERNTQEFTDAMPAWRDHGLLAFSLNLQGGSPTGYGNKEWINSAFDRFGGLRSDYFNRLNKILQKADDLGMVVILGLFYFGQDQHLLGEFSIIQAVDNTIEWLFDAGYRNVLIEVNNECDVPLYDHDVLEPQQVAKLIKRIKQKEKNGFRFLVSTSFGGNVIPVREVIEVSDFILLHGNNVERPERISAMVQAARMISGPNSKPIIFNEDDHYDFDRQTHNFVNAITSYASWGYFDYRREGESFLEGYQSVPVDWSINSRRKKAFFEKLAEITGMGGDKRSPASKSAAKGWFEVGPQMRVVRGALGSSERNHSSDKALKLSISGSGESVVRLAN